MAGPSVELQDLILARLKAASAVTAIVGQRIYDRPPSTAELPYISIGPSDIVPLDADCIAARQETVQIDVWHRNDGRRWPCKATVDAVRSALHGFDGDLASHALVEMRAILAMVMEDPDGITIHGVIQIAATIEER